MENTMKEKKCFTRKLMLAATLLLSCGVYADITPVSTENVLKSGDGYQLKEITYLDESGQSRTVQQYYINNVDGAVNAYLGAGLPYEEVVAIQEEVDGASLGGGWGRSARKASINSLVSDASEQQFTWVIDRRGATLTSEAEAQQYIKDFNLEDVVAAEALVPNGDIPDKSNAKANAKMSARGFFSSCFGWRDRDRNFNKTIDENFSHDKTFGTGVATVNFKGKLDVDANVALNLQYQYRRAFCIPYKFRFKQLNANANYEAIGDFSITGKVEKNFGSYDWKIAEPQIMDVWFAIGPIPVRVAMNLPIEVGTGNINVKVVGQVATYKAIHFKGDFNYVCTTSGCAKISSNHQNFNQSVQSTIGASLSANVTLAPYVHIAAKPYVYGEWFFYLQVGIKPSFPIDLYGYYGNLCEDGNNNGVNETVSAAIGTLAIDVGITGEAKIFGGYILRPKYWQVFYKDLLLVDFLNPGSSAFTPVLRPTINDEAMSVGLPVSIRSCVTQYASRFPVSYTVNWGDGSANQSVSVGSSQQLAHTYPGPGTYLVIVNYKNGVDTSVYVTIQDNGLGGGW
jgi:hypothetical protein